MNVASPQRRGFALPMVILVSVVAGLVVAVALQRMSAQQLMVRRQLTEYHRHHDVLGARAVIRYWVSRQQDLGKFVSDTIPARRFSLPGGMRVTVFVGDGQGQVKGDLTDESPPDRRRMFEDLFYRLPPGRADLVRRAGPAEISVNAAPREVLQALREEDSGLAAAIMQARSGRRLDAGSFRSVLERQGLRQEEITQILRLVTYEPGVWRLTVDAELGGETRRFTALVEPRQNDPILHEWREKRRSADQLNAAERELRRATDKGRN